MAAWWSTLPSEAQAAWIQAFGSVIAIFVAIGVAWAQARQAHKQQHRQWILDRNERMLSARPHLSIERSVQRQDPQLRIYLRNDGLGPALIKSFRILLDGRQLRYEGTTFWFKLVRALDLPPGVNSGGVVLADDTTLPAGAKRRLLRYRPADQRVVTTAILNEKLDRVGFDIRYESIYGEEFRLDVLQDPDHEILFCLGEPPLTDQSS